MSIADETGQYNSITEVWPALRLFTNRQKLIKLFVSYLNDDPPRNTILFFHGDGGNGKSLLLRYLRENFCKRFKRENWEWLKNEFQDEELVEQIKSTTVSLVRTPFAEIDFHPETKNPRFPQEAFDGLLMLRGQLGKHSIRFPLFDYACTWYLYKTDQLTRQRLSDLLPAEEIDALSEIVDVASETSYGKIFKFVIGIGGKRVEVDFKLWRQKIGLDKTRVAEIQQKDAKTDLIKHLPDFFAEDLNAAMEKPNAPERIVLFFDTHESFWGHQRNMPEKDYVEKDEWLRRLLLRLKLQKGFVAVVAGRENPNSESKRESQRRWTDATDCDIPEDHIDAHLVGHLPPEDADIFLRRAGITDITLRKSLTKYAEVERGEVHPMLLGLLVDIILTADRENIEVSAADFHYQPQTGKKAQKLINRLLSWVDLDTRYAVIALAACRAFDEDIFEALGNSLRFDKSRADFEILRSFSFVWQAERRGAGWYRIHELLRRLVTKNDKSKTDAAHGVLEKYYRQRYTDGDELAIAEAIYHANQIDWERGIDEWTTIFQHLLELSRYDACRALLEVSREMVIGNDFYLGYVSQLEGDFHFSLSHYTEAKQELAKAVEAYDRALELAPDDTAALNNKGIALQSRGELEVRLTKYDDALQSYQNAVEAYDRALEFAPDYTAALNNKGLVLQKRGNIEVALSNYDDALQSYQNAVEAYDRVLEFAPDYTYVLNNKGLVLQKRGNLRNWLGQTNEACQDWRTTLTMFSRSLKIAPSDKNIQSKLQETENLITEYCREN